MARSEGLPELIDFLEKIETGGTAHVVKARIDGHIYALKVFIPVTVFPGWFGTSEEVEGRVDDGLLTAHMNPFFAECRAYGRLKEVGKEHLAVRCHGYITLTASQKEDLETRLGPFDWGNEEDLKGDPIRVIVKDFVPGTVQFNHTHARKLLRDMRELHRCAILVADVKPDMYVNGVLVDFSHARTLPHLLFDPGLGFDPYAEGQEAVWDDLASLDHMFKVWNKILRKENSPKITIRASPNLVLLSRLRNKKPVSSVSNTRVFDPTKFDWRKYSQRNKGSVCASTAKRPTGVVKNQRKSKARNATPKSKRR